VLLQRFLIERPLDRLALYWRAQTGHHSAVSDHPFVEAVSVSGVVSDRATAGIAGADRALVERLGDGRLRVRKGSSVSFDTYFNSFFESQWRRYTALGTLVLKIEIEGSGTLRIHRRALNQRVLIHEQVIGPGATVIRLPSHAINFRQHGTLAAHLEAMDGDLTFVEAGWWSDEQAPATVRLAPIFCTFNREAAIGNVLASLASDPVVAERIASIIVVNQGRPGLLQHPTVRASAEGLLGKLHTVEQGNFGGSGGFARGLLEASANVDITHVVLLDDDIVLEPDSLLRMASFFAFCHGPLVIGGNMLDLLQPTQLYEGGAIVKDRHWTFEAQRTGLDIGSTANFERLSHPEPVHYNGWWCCGFPISVVVDHGMPLPCFIRGDDVEFGVRLHNIGIPTVPMPGIAVWHEPFYLKLGSWHFYYETRNVLVAAALHLPSTRSGIIRRVARQVLLQMLTFRYYNAALILTGVADFLEGPTVMHQPPGPRHASLTALLNTYGERKTSRETVLLQQGLQATPRTRFACLRLLAWLIVRNAAVATPVGPPNVLEGRNLTWLAMRGVEHIAVETWWDPALPTLRRSREHHRALLRQTVTLLLRLYREHPAVAAAWRADAPTLRSKAFWRRYLGLPVTPTAAVPCPTPVVADAQLG
jgi:galactofuranosylgalactofuranosylrhamnosyl-N-acetylglucosaminyl-diphospho-decaprenol beta-1,5/1,6-galactofuranosyltransferase